MAAATDFTNTRAASTMKVIGAVGSARCCSSSSAVRRASTCETLLAQTGGHFALVFRRLDIGVRHDHPRATVPAQKRVIVRRRTHRFGTLEVVHRLPKTLKGGRAAPRRIRSEPGDRLALPNDPREVF